MEEANFIMKNLRDEWPVLGQIHQSYLVKFQSCEHQNVKTGIEETEKMIEKLDQDEDQIIEKLKKKLVPPKWLLPYSICTSHIYNNNWASMKLNCAGSMQVIFTSSNNQIMHTPSINVVYNRIEFYLAEFWTVRSRRAEFIVEDSKVSGRGFWKKYCLEERGVAPSAGSSRQTVFCEQSIRSGNHLLRGRAKYLSKIKLRQWMQLEVQFLLFFPIESSFSLSFSFFLGTIGI